MKPPICVGVHAVFANDAYEELLNAGAGHVITCNTINYPSNVRDLAGLLIESVQEYLN